MNTVWKTIFGFFVLVWAAVGQAQANPVQKEYTKAELISAVAQAAPGQTFRVGLTLTPRDGWHTYWRNPGDSGMATSIAWELPAGVSASEIIWPGPDHIPYGPLVNFGYKGAVTLLVDITIAADNTATSVPLKARADWLVCEEICVPEDAELTLTLPLGQDSQANPNAAAVIARAEQRLPQAYGGQSTARVGAQTIDLTVATLPSDRKIFFFPYAENSIENATPQTVTQKGEGGDIAITRGFAKTVPDFSGVLRIDHDSGAAFYELNPVVESVAAPSAAAESSADSGITVWQAVLFAFIGGLILNLMPCVFPVLSLKALAIANKAASQPGEVRAEALVFTLGVLVSFAVLAAALLAVRAGGEAVGWGFQLQSPLVVLILAYVLFAVGLSLSGVFSLGSRLGGVGQSLAAKSGYAGAFFTGVLATVVATPCTAPFMAGAIGFALTQSAVMAVVIFLALGLGLAAPFLILGFVPALYRRLPKPGAWMDTFKQALAFPMYGAAAWLVWVLAQQAGPMGVAAALTGLLLIAFAAWAYGRAAGREGRLPLFEKALAVVAIVAALALLRVPETVTAAPTGTTAASGAWSADRVTDLRADGKPVFVNFTAAWCITCLANERMALSSPAVADALKQHGVTYLKADWTNRDPAITAALQQFGRSGVPLYVLYPADPSAAPQILPQILTEGMVIDALKDLTKP